VRVVGVVALGGALGAVLRELLTLAVPDSSTGFPWTVFAVNVVGCAALAALPAVTAVLEHPLLPPLLGPGLLGGFTTLSTYAEQARALAAAGRTALAGAYVLGTLAACLVAVLLADQVTSAAQRRRFDDEEGDL
jgi:CrcB protein